MQDMASFDPHPPAADPGRLETDPVVLGRRHAAEDPLAPSKPPRRGRRRILGTLRYIFPLLLVCCFVGYFAARHWLRSAIYDSLPQVDGTLSVPGLHAPVTVQRDAHGVPHIHAASMDDLVFAQGFITAQDRLFQLEMLRRHAAGTLSEILGSSMLKHDTIQRTLQIGAAADRAVAALPPDQLHWLAVYAQGVNASIDAQRDHLPAEFRLLHITPAPWTPRDSMLVGLVMFQDLTNTFPVKLAREAIAAKLPPDLVADLYPVGSWRDRPVTQPLPDLTQPQDVPEIPLDESQVKLHEPENPLLRPARLRGLVAALQNPDLSGSRALCNDCVAGSNNWVVSGARTATGKPLLSNDMHLTLTVPGIWYEVDLKAGGFHVAGVSLPGTPFVIVGHNDHIAWGFTNLGADVQDLTLEHLRGSGKDAEFQAADGSWQPLLHRQEIIHVRAGRTVTLEIPETRHGALVSPIISSLFPEEHRPVSLRWTIYDPTNVTIPFFAVNSATDWTSFCAAFSGFGGPAQNVVYADDQGNIGYHAVGRIPLRGDPAHPSLPALVPAPPDSSHEWTGYIPFDQLPQIYDPPGGILATANARVVGDDYPFPITQDWNEPYRNERIWKVLAVKQGLTATDMLALQNDIYSDLDHSVAQRLAYAIDHAHLSSDQKRLHQAADLLRRWNGKVEANASAPAIVNAARTALWKMILTPKLGETAALYRWGERSYAEEQIIMHAPARWLPKGYATWDDLLADSVEKGLHESRAPGDLSTWLYGRIRPVEIEHPLFGTSPLLRDMVGMPVGTGMQPQSGDSTTVKQVGRSFGPSERFTADLSDLDHSTLNLVLGESGNPASPWFMDQWQAWYTGKTFPLPYSDAEVNTAATHTLTLTPR